MLIFSRAEQAIRRDFLGKFVVFLADREGALGFFELCTEIGSVVTDSLSGGLDFYFLSRVALTFLLITC